MYPNSERQYERTQTGMAPGFLKTCGFFGWLLIALALITIPCSASDGQDSSTVEALAGNILVNQIGDASKSPVNSTETRTVGLTIDPAAETADTGDRKAPPGPALSSATVENAGTPAASPAPAESVHAMASVATPIAGFSASPTTGTAPLAVTFADESTGSPTGWTWFFGDETYDNVWKQQTAHADWPARYDFTSVVLPDGSIVIMGGVQTIDGNPTRYFNDTWRSTDAGNTWIQQNASSGWSKRMGMTSTVLPEGSIILIGGVGSNNKIYNDVWISADKGVTWARQDIDWPGEKRSYLSSVTMPDGIVLAMGGIGESGYKNDVLWSPDKGKIWYRQIEHAEWSPRSAPSVVLMPDNSILLMGGTNAGGSAYHDVWRSTDTGKSWKLQTGNAPWAQRWASSAMAMPDGSIVLMAGGNLTQQHNDVWRSVDNGVSWEQVNVGWWERRSGQAGVALPDGRIVLMGGMGGTFLAPASLNDVWQMKPTGSSLQNPTHTYATPGTYNVTQQVYNANAFTSIRKDAYISVNAAPPVVGFEYSFGGSDHEFGHMSVPTSDDGVLVLGTAQSSDGDLAGTGFHGKQDITLTKFSKTGTLEWTHSYGGESGETDGQGILDLNPGYLVYGTTYAKDGNMTGSGYHGGGDAWVAVLDSSGTIIRQHSFGGRNNDVPRYAIKLPSGNFLFVGSTNSYDGDISDYHGEQTGLGYNDGWVFEIDPYLNLKWSKCFGGTEEDVLTSVTPTQDFQSIIVAGETRSKDGDLLGTPYHEYADLWVFKINLTDTTHPIETGWNLRFGGDGVDRAASIQPTPHAGGAGGYLVAGTTSSVNGNITSNHGGDDIWVLKLNDNGSLAWQKTYGGTKDDIAQALRIWTEKSGYFILGTTASNDGDISGNHGGNSGTSDMALIKIDYDGNILYSQCYGGTLDEFGVRFGDRPASSSYSYIIGTTYSNDSDIHGRHGSEDTSDIAILRLDKKSAYDEDW